MSTTNHYDHAYARSLAGLCKLSCLLCSFIGFLCIACSTVRLNNFCGCTYMIVTIVGFLATLELFLAHFLGFWQRKCLCLCDAKDWELYVHSSLAMAYFLASGLVLSLDIGSYTAAATFGLTVFCINALEAYASYKRSRQRNMSTQTV